MEYLYFSVGAGVLLAVIFVALLIVQSVQKHKFNKMLQETVDNYNRITLGMKRSQMLALMGNDYTLSQLKDGTEKYEWKIKVSGKSTGYYHNGAGVRHYQSGYTVAMMVKVKNGVVIEKKGNNLDLGNTTDFALYNYDKVKVGMPVEQAKSLLGSGYTVSMLKDGTERYEWKIREGGTSYSIYSAGVHSSTSSGTMTRKITVLCKNGVVIEVTGNNLD